MDNEEMMQVPVKYSMLLTKALRAYSSKAYHAEELFTSPNKQLRKLMADIDEALMIVSRPSVARLKE